MWPVSDILTKANLNSRLCHLLMVATVCLCTLILVIAFTRAGKQDLYPEMIGILLSGGVGSAIGRYFTMKGSSAATRARRGTDMVAAAPAKEE